MIKIKHFDALDTLRTALALLVACGHFYLWNGVFDKISYSFALVVDLFFVLSGFVLSQSVIADKRDNFEDFLKRFFIRRFFRLFPLYILLFLISAIILILKLKGLGDPIYEYIISLFLLQGTGLNTTTQYLLADSVPGISWSISVELWISLPFFAFVYIFRNKPMSLMLVCAITFIISLMIMVHNSPNFMDVPLAKVYGNITGGVLRSIIGFTAGCIAFRLYQILSSKNFSNIYLFRMNRFS